MPVASGRVQKIKAMVTHAQNQLVVQVGSNNGLPGLQSLKYDQCLRELADIAQTGTSAKVKSQGEGQVQVFVGMRVKWPHEFVLSGSTKECISYDQLTLP